MAYVEKVPSPKGDYWRARVKNPEGKYVSVRDEHGGVMRFRRKQDAEDAAEDASSDVRNDRYVDPDAGNILFEDWADAWYGGLDLAESTMENRKLHLETHLMPFFKGKTLREIEEGGPALITRWERHEKAGGALPGSIKTWRGTLHTCLEDARKAKRITVNPATVDKGRGKRSGRRITGKHGTERPFTDTFGILLIAERVACLTGQDQEFVMIVTKYVAALRLGELIGLEKPYVRQKNLRVEWQLSEVAGRLLRAVPKDDSQGDVVMPPFLRQLLAAHMRQVPPEPCPCHGREYVFRGHGVPKPKWNKPLRELADRSGIPLYTIRQALNGTRPVSEAKRLEVLEAADRFGFERLTFPDQPAWHWRHSAFEEKFTAAVSGWFPPHGGQPRRRVLLRGDFPGERVTGPRAEKRAEFWWLPVEGAEGMTPHGARHSSKVTMEENRIPEIMSETQMRHNVGGVSGAYRHVSGPMKKELADMWEREWTAALDRRLKLAELCAPVGGPLSPVTVLDGLLRERLEARKLTAVPSDSPETANVVGFPGVVTHSDLQRSRI